jgi:hypothetical protein
MLQSYLRNNRKLSYVARGKKNNYDLENAVHTNYEEQFFFLSSNSVSFLKTMKINHDFHYLIAFELPRISRISNTKRYLSINHIIFLWYEPFYSAYSVSTPSDDVATATTSMSVGYILATKPMRRSIDKRASHNLRRVPSRHTMALTTIRFGSKRTCFCDGQTVHQRELILPADDSTLSGIRSGVVATYQNVERHRETIAERVRTCLQRPNTKFVYSSSIFFLMIPWIFKRS